MNYQIQLILSSHHLFLQKGVISNICSAASSPTPPCSHLQHKEVVVSNLSHQAGHQAQNILSNTYYLLPPAIRETRTKLTSQASNCSDGYGNEPLHFMFLACTVQPRCSLGSSSDESCFQDPALGKVAEQGSHGRWEHGRWAERLTRALFNWCGNAPTDSHFHM